MAITKFKDSDSEDDENSDGNEVPLRPKWYDMLKDEPLESEKISEHTVLSYKLEAQKALEDEVKRYQLKLSKAPKSSDQGWLYTVLQKGTSGDKMAAHILSIQNAPVCNLNSLSTLIGMVKVAKKKQCLSVIDNLTDLFLEDLLPPEKQLRFWEMFPFKILTSFSGTKERRERLVCWLFEAKLKELFDQFLSALETVSRDTVEAHRGKAISAMHRLLSNRPEKEQMILKSLVNKLGDPSKKIVSKVIYCLNQLLKVHPSMKKVVMQDVEKLIFRPNIGMRTQYYAICFLSQYIFLPEDEEVAKNIIKIYFSFFKASVKKNEIDSRLMGALLMGVKRAYPYARLNPSSLSEHTDTLYRLVHIAPFNISLHTLSLLEQVSQHSQDRFYCALYKKLLDPKLMNTTYQAMFINLMFKALANDENYNRVSAIIKRIFQIGLHLPVPFLCGLLYMVSQLLYRKSQLRHFESKASKIALFAEEDSDDEVYKDADKVEEEKSVEDKKDIGWNFVNMTAKSKIKVTDYDWTARNPSFAGAESSAYFELLVLSKHVHPTISLFAQKILNNELIVYTGDPLSDFTLLRFLERFVFKNPKGKEQVDTTKGPDIRLAQRKYYRPTGAKALNVTSQTYLKLGEENIPVDELFLFRYLKDKNINICRGKGKDDDIESVASDEFEEILEKMIGTKEKLDFMEDIGNKLKEPKGKKKKEEESEESSESEEDNLSDIEDDDEAIDFEGGSDDEKFDLNFSDIDEESDERSKTKEKKGKKGGFNGLFAAAEEFSELLEDAGNSKNKGGMAHTLHNPENAAAKQLTWEINRDRWIRGANNKKRKFKNSNNKLKKKVKT